MSNKLKDSVREEVQLLSMQGLTIKGIAARLKISKNTVRRVLRSDGLSIPEASTKPWLKKVPEEVPTQPQEFRFLELLFSKARMPIEKSKQCDFERHIKSLATDVATELGVTSR